MKIEIVGHTVGDTYRHGKSVILHTAKEKGEIVIRIGDSYDGFISVQAKTLLSAVNALQKEVDE